MTEVVEEKEIIETATIQAMGRNKYGNLEEEDLKEALKNQDVTVEKSGRNFKLTFKKSNRKYIINSNGEAEPIEEIKPTAIYAKLEADGTLKLRSTPLQGYEEGTKWNSPDILKVLIEEPIAPKTCERMFSQCINLESIENMNYLHTENATSMERMFQKCEKLKNINTSYLDTHNVKDMSYMFGNCLLLEKIDVSNFNTAKVTTMQYMFMNCSSLETLDLRSFNTKSIQGNGRERMFRFDSNLSKILVSKDWSLDYNGATQVFEGCGVKEVTVVE